MSAIKIGYVYRKGLFGFWYHQHYKLCDDGTILFYRNFILKFKMCIVGVHVEQSEYGNRFFITICKNNRTIVYLYFESETERQECIDIILTFQQRGAFKINELLGTGSFGKVFLCKSEHSEQSFAMKIMNRSKDLHRFDLEEKLMQIVTHPFLMKAHDCFKINGQQHIVMKYMIGGDLGQYLDTRRTLTENESRFYGAQLVSALIYLHNKGIVHRDVKLANLMMDEDGYVVLGDYGSSIHNNDDNLVLTGVVGTPAYMAPEIFDGAYGFAIDWWSTGVILYKMMTGKFPPWQMNKPEDLSHIISYHAEQFLLGLLKKSPNNRLGGDTVQNHPFFANIDFNELIAKKYPAPYIPTTVALSRTHYSILARIADYVRRLLGWI